MMSVSTAVWIHSQDTKEMCKEKARWEQLQNDTRCFEQILKAATHKTTAVLSLTCHLTSHPSKTNTT